MSQSSSMISSAVSWLFRRINRWSPWHRLPFPLAIANLVALRHDLRQWNLYDTQRSQAPDPAPGPAWTAEDWSEARSADGSHNDLTQPRMGMARSRMGRNVPIRLTFPETGEQLLDPNPIAISRKLLDRKAFQPVPHLNVLAAAWLQFMVHDWFSHGKNAHPNDPSKRDPKLHEPIRVPIPPEYRTGAADHILIHRTMPDLDHVPADQGKPPAYRNVATQWWDASQLYGSWRGRQEQLRAVDPRAEPPYALLPGGKLHLRDGHLPTTTVAHQNASRPAEELELTGESGNFWIGLSVLHTLFAREHNLLCDLLAAHYPHKKDDGEWLFNKARLIVAALIAKIHTVEWTPGILNTTELRFGMRGNWWGLLGERFVRGYGRVVKSETLGGLVESPTDHHSADYSITEEFNAVYRMHSLLPDRYSFRGHQDDSPVAELDLLQVAGANVPKLYQERGVSLVDALYSLGTENPGLLKLHNFPVTLTRLARQAPASRTVDLATIDLLRDRERGVPRYCAFREALRMPVPRTFEELTGGDTAAAAELKAVYGHVRKVDLLVGCAAEPWPEGFGFSDTAFRIFIVMASRRLKSDRFFTSDYRPEVYTPFGLRWIADNGFASVVLRHFPELAPNLHGVKNAFGPWKRGTAAAPANR